MRPLVEYDIYIFDCDGVIFDSNRLKICAMEHALCSINLDKDSIRKCTEYFSCNFGKSRFHHIEYFIDNFISVDNGQKDRTFKKIFDTYSLECMSLYMTAEITPGFIPFIRKLNGKKYIASGSMQSELREVFDKRSLSKYFKAIYGSPKPKGEIIKSIITENPAPTVVMFGDAISDLEASIENNIDFIGYLPFSNVKEKLTSMVVEQKGQLITDWNIL